MKKFIIDFIKAVFKLISIIFLLLLFFSIYWGIRRHQYEEELKEISKPFIEACKKPDGCILIPLGWRLDNSNNSYYRNGMQYSATKEKFTISWHIAIDTYLNATGGKNMELEIDYEYE